MAPVLQKADVVIVGVTKSFGRLCVGGLDANGRAYRLHEKDQDFRSATHKPAIGECWTIEYIAAPAPPPHIEDVRVHHVVETGQVEAKQFIESVATIHSGRIEDMFDGCLIIDPSSSASTGKLCVGPNKIPAFSVQFCRLDRDLSLDSFPRRWGGYDYTYRGNGFAVKYAGTETSPPMWLREGTLVRFSLSKWWKPPTAAEDQPQVCNMMLSGWF